LRGGLQSSDNLVYLADPLMQTYLDALAGPVSDYIRQLSGDDNHPLESRCSSSFTFTGCWSVLLRPGGFHVNHTHPQGWISSPITCPFRQACRRQAGRLIKFGEPRWPHAGCDIERTVQPKEGRLVLFPSHFWHGTIPFSSASASPRLSMSCLHKRDAAMKLASSTSTAH